MSSTNEVWSLQKNYSNFIRQYNIKRPLTEMGLSVSGRFYVWEN
ncbi:hypothetical protein HMPREF1548_05682 [Clostridium sp. KLE 1755]|nr:hypothetical protein HMPREF1548_05682 [Clostridium sp. KLE 1755]